MHRCLARNPGARYPSASAARDALESVLESTGSGPLRRPTSGLGAAVPRPPTAPAARARPQTGEHPEPAGPAREHVTAPTLRAPPARRRQAWLWVLAAAIVVVAVAVAIYLATRGDGGSGTPPSTVAGAPAGGFSIKAAKDFDPLGNDGQEDPQQVSNVHDGDASTSWSTEMYVDFQRDKQGVGVWVQLDRVHSIASVTVTTVQSGWSGAIYVADQPGGQLADWGAVRARGADLGTTKTFALHGVRGQYVLLWLTKLPGDVGDQRLQVSEVQVG